MKFGLFFSKDSIHNISLRLTSCLGPPPFYEYVLSFFKLQQDNAAEANQWRRKRRHQYYGYSDTLSTFTQCYTSYSSPPFSEYVYKPAAPLHLCYGGVNSSVKLNGITRHVLPLLPSNKICLFMFVKKLIVINGKNKQGME